MADVVAVQLGHNVPTGMQVRRPADGELVPLGPQIFPVAYKTSTGTVTTPRPPTVMQTRPAPAVYSNYIYWTAEVTLIPQFTFTSVFTGYACVQFGSTSDNNANHCKMTVKIQKSGASASIFSAPSTPSITGDPVIYMDTFQVEKDVDYTVTATTQAALRGYTAATPDPSVVYSSFISLFNVASKVETWP